MSDHQPHPKEGIAWQEASLSRDDLRQMIAICDRFEAMWKAGENPRVEAYLGDAPEQLHFYLLSELRAIESELRRDLGDDTSIDSDRLKQSLSLEEDETASRHAVLRATTSKGIPSQLGDYVILREIGRGGMGVVYEAVQQSLGRHVALKILPWHQIGDSSQLERFQDEPRLAARLHHSNIVPVFGVGEDHGVHYYAMQYIKGDGLNNIIDELRALRLGQNLVPPPEGSVAEEKSFRSSASAVNLARKLLTGRFAGFPTGDGRSLDTTETKTKTATFHGPAPATSPSTVLESSTVDCTDLTDSSPHDYFREVARIGLQVAEALAYAHGQGILHRDIKPSNLLIDSSGTVWVADFGLAKAEGSDGLTRPGEIVGTLRYMAPERFKEHTDHRSDLYSLGATLYELLTLRPLFGAVNRLQLEKHIQHDAPKAPRSLDPRIPRDLETVVLKALAKDPDRRYVDAEAMAADLQRVLDDQPIEARRISSMERAWRWCCRHKAIASLLATVQVLLVVGLVGSLLAARRFDRLADETRISAAESEAVVDFLIKDMLALANPFESQGESYTVEDLLARADRAIEDEERFKDQPLVEASIRLILGHIFRSRQESEKAFPHLSRAVVLYEEHAGEADSRTLDAMTSLTWVYMTLGHTEQALRLAEQRLERSRSSSDTDHFEELKGILLLSDICTSKKLGRFDDVLDLLGPALSDFDRLGTHNAHRCYAYRIYGKALLELNRFDEAELVLLEASRVGHDNYGPDHPQVIFLDTYISQIYQRRGDLGQALLLLEAVVERARRVLPLGHSHREVPILELAELLHQSGKQEEAFELLEGEYDAFLADSGPPIVAMFFPMRQYYSMLAIAGESDRSLEVATQVIARLQGSMVETYGSVYQALPLYQNQLAWMIVTSHEALWTEENLALAIELSEATVSAALGGWDEGCYKNTLGVAQYRSGDWKGAIVALEQSDADLQGKLFCTNGFFLAMAHARLGHQELALDYYDRSVDWLEKYSPDTGEFLHFRAEAEALLRPLLLGATFPSDPFMQDE